MIDEIKNIISKEKDIIKIIRTNPQNKNLINNLLELNNQIQLLLYNQDIPKKEIVSSQKKQNIIPLEERKIESFLQSKKLAIVSNKLFRKKSEKLSIKYKNIGQDLQKANVGVLLQTYISISLFITLISFLSGIAIFFVLYFIRIIPISYLWLIILPPSISIILFYFFPSGEASNIQKKISNELPFATIHMAAIAGSDMEPTKIFQIIAMSKEYKNIGKELRKVLNQVNIYGYDLLTSLINVAKTISNKKLSELLLGLATNISSGGSLKVYLEKKAETYLIDYKLERKQYIETAGTFMDIYISILIAAPLIMMLMFIIMSVANLNVGGLSLQMLLFLTIGAVAVLNIVFIFVLNLKQPAV